MMEPAHGTPRKVQMNLSTSRAQACFSEAAQRGSCKFFEGLFHCITDQYTAEPHPLLQDFHAAGKKEAPQALG